MEFKYLHPAKVLNVVDGDTFDALVDLGFRVLNKIRFRVDGLDTPETWRPKTEKEMEHGLAATKLATELLDNQNIMVESHKLPGKYGRWGATVTLPDGRDFATVMKEAGFEKKESYE